jgi:hypothetical protein
VLVAGGVDSNNIGLGDVWWFDGSFTYLGRCQRSVGAPGHWIDDVLWLLGDKDGKVVTYNLTNNTSSVIEGGPPVMNCASALWEDPGSQEKLIFIFGGIKKSPL